MSAAPEIIEEVFKVIEGGTTLGTPAQIIQFPSDNGQKVYQAVQQTYKGANGSGFNYWVAAFLTGVGEAAKAVSAGAAFLTMEVGAVGAAVAPALGITTGYALYNLAPEFWTGVANALMEAGCTVKGKVVCFMNEHGVMTFPKEVIEIFKNALLEVGAFTVTVTPYDGSVGDLITVNDLWVISARKFVSDFLSPGWRSDFSADELAGEFFSSKYQNFIAPNDMGVVGSSARRFEWHGIDTSSEEFLRVTSLNDGIYETSGIINANHYIAAYKDMQLFTYNNQPASLNGRCIEVSYYQNDPGVTGIYVGDITKGTPNIPLQDGAKLPGEEEFPLTYPDWFPFNFPDIDGQHLPDSYPLNYPDNLPSEEPYQDDSQNPGDQTEDDPDKVIETITDPENDPFRDYNIDDWEFPDPDPETEDPDPLPDDGDDYDGGEDPIDPDPDDPITPIIPDPPLPITVNSNKLFTVYNPSIAELNQLGGYLWDNNLIDTLRKIWQNPLDGIIGLMQVYCTPVTGGRSKIILGYLDSGVTAPVVSDQFVTIDCGSVDIKEINKNATDYSPYSALQLYLPFIGIAEIDNNDFMAGTISIKYHVDVYTGTCLAEVKCTRDRDLKHGAIIYTFNGNCSQQIPLTGGDQKGLLMGLISAAGAGLSIASGGSLTPLGVTGMLNAGVSREMLHVSHSGNLSANAGIMGQKKPYVIITRQKPYNANSYSKFYGFPVNKTVFLGNCSGFVRIKAGKLVSKATEEEKKEIMEYLNNGVIL